MTRHYNNYSVDQLKEAVSASNSIAGVCRKLGLKGLGGNIKTIKTKISVLDLDISHFSGQPWNKGLYQNPEKTKKREDIRKYMVKHYGYKCWECGNTEWNGKPIPLELEHVDGNTSNNEVTNLKMLCCNCHAQTPTWRRAKTASASL